MDRRIQHTAGLEFWMGGKDRWRGVLVGRMLNTTWEDRFDSWYSAQPTTCVPLYDDIAMACNGHMPWPYPHCILLCFAVATVSIANQMRSSHVASG